MNRTTMKPGYMVSLKTSITGNVSYKRVDLDKSRDGSQEVEKWETTRFCMDGPEYDRAKEIRGKARNMVIGVCVSTSYATLCPIDREADLESAIQQAEALVSQFNREAVHTRIGFYPLAVLVESDNERATRAITAEVRELLDKMTAGIQSFDKDSIRDAADRAKAIGQMLDSSKQEQVNAAVDAARKAARQITKAIKEAGENARLVIGEINAAPIAVARFSFLDVDADNCQPAPEPEAAMPAVSVQRFDGLFDGLDGAPEPDGAQLEPVQST